MPRQGGGRLPETLLELGAEFSLSQSRARRSGWPQTLWCPQTSCHLMACSGRVPAKENGLEVAGPLSARGVNLRRLDCVCQWALFPGLPLFGDPPRCLPAAKEHDVCPRYLGLRSEPWLPGLHILMVNHDEQHRLQSLRLSVSAFIFAGAHTPG